MAGILDIGGGIGAGLGQAGQAIRQYGQDVQSAGLNQQKMQMNDLAIEQTKMQTNAMKQAEAARAAQEKAMSAPKDVKDMFGGIESIIPKTVNDMLIPAMRKGGAIDDVAGVPTSSGKKLGIWAEANKDQLYGIMTNALGEIRAQEGELRQKAQELQQSKPDSKELPQIQSQLEKLGKIKEWAMQKAGMLHQDMMGEKGLTGESLLAMRASQGDTQAKSALDTLQNRKLELKKTTADMPGGGFSAMTPEQQNTWYESYEQTGKLPPFAWKDKAGRDAFTAGYSDYLANKGETATDAVVKRASMDANKRSLADITKRETLTNTFVTRIDATSKVVERLAKEYGNRDSRLLNMPINKLEGFVGSGELASLKLALRSLSNEVAKVESGSLGIAEVSVQQAEAMNKIHDADLSVADLMKVLGTSKELGVTSMQSLKQAKGELLSEMKGSTSPTEAPSAPAQQTKSTGGKVRVKSPDGKTGFIPAENLDKALKQGYTRIQ